MNGIVQNGGDTGSVPGTTLLHVTTIPMSLTFLAGQDPQPMVSMRAMRLVAAVKAA
jgi:hypothetical protein